MIKEIGRTALVLYGSETGTAHDVAEEVGRIVERLHFATQILSLDATEPAALTQHAIVIIAISTTGQGDLPNNARHFWKRLLRRKLPPSYLEGANVTSFGLGDSSYPKFNWAARKLHKRLIQLGARELYPCGEADEQHAEGLDATFLPWSIKLREQLLELFPLESGIHPIPDDVLLEPRWTLALVEPVNTNGHISTANGGSSEAIRNGSSNLKGNSSPDELLDVLLVENRRTTSSNHWQDVRHLVLESQHQASYAPGDTITIYPMNAEGDVEHLLSLMDWTGVADEPINFVPAARTRATDMVPPLPIANIRPRSHLTLRKLLMKHLDITAIPRRSFFAFVAHFASNPMQKERLLEFTNPEYVDELYDYTTRPRRSILEVIQEFDSIKIPWQWATSVLPELRGRQFSIASGGQLKKGESNITRFELSVAIVKYKTVIKKIREGVCTRYLARIPTGSHMQVTLQKGGLSITKAEARLPVVMIGPGTGVAPMRSLIWERLEWAEELHNGQNKTDHGSTNTTVNIGESVLFFGCRNREKDFLYEDEWEGLEKKMNLKVFTAFSRDQKRKVYVQDRIREQSDLVFRLLHECGGVVYICGSSGKMPQAVREALIEVFQGGTRMEREDAEAYLIQMEKEGRYKQETW